MSSHPEAWGILSIILEIWDILGYRWTNLPVRWQLHAKPWAYSKNSHLCVFGTSHWICVFVVRVWRVPGGLQRVMDNRVAIILLRRFTPGSIAFEEKRRLVIRKSNWAYDVACRCKANTPIQNLLNVMRVSHDWWIRWYPHLFFCARMKPGQQGVQA